MVTFRVWVFNCVNCFIVLQSGAWFAMEIICSDFGRSEGTSKNNMSVFCQTTIIYARSVETGNEMHSNVTPHPLVGMYDSMAI